MRRGNGLLDGALAGRAASAPGIRDPMLRRRVGELHTSLGGSGDELEAESRLALVGGRLLRHLGSVAAEPAARGVAHDLRDLLDARLREGVTLREAGALLGAHPDSLVRAVTAAFGLPPHHYLTGRRLDAARARLLAGEAPADVAATVGFHDQSHLTRHFKRLLGATPAAYARSTSAVVRGGPRAGYMAP